MIDISQWLIGLGVTGFEEPTANNQYEFFKGVQWSDGTVTNNQYDFFKKVGQSRYDHFKQFGNERQFYKDIAVPVIKDYYTFYKYARDYITFYDYLLDNYPNAAAAYSLRKLNSTYTGDCIEVRRDSDNTVLNIGFVNNELDTNTLSTFCAGANGYVTTWYDQSGNGYDAIQTVASGQPKIYDASTGVILNNGKPSIYFDGVDDSLNSNSLIGKTRLDTYFVVDTNDVPYLYPTGENFGGKYGFAADEYNNTILTANYGTPSLYANSQLFTGTVRNEVYNFLDGRKLVVHQNANTSNWLEYSFGKYTTSTYSFSGYFSELIAYDSDQSSNRTAIEDNINQRYNIYQ